MVICVVVDIATRFLNDLIVDASEGLFFAEHKTINDNLSYLMDTGLWI